MQLDDLSDDAVVTEIGRRVVAHRMARNWTQGEFADRAGVGRSTVQRIERGDSIQLSSLVKLLRALERLAGLDAVLAPEIRSPIADLERERRRQRQRVRHPRRRDAREDAAPWAWGDDEGDRA